MVGKRPDSHPETLVLVREVEGRVRFSDVSNGSTACAVSLAVNGRASAEPMSFNVSDRARTAMEGAIAATC